MPPWFAQVPTWTCETWDEPGTRPVSAIDTRNEVASLKTLPVPEAPLPSTEFIVKVAEGVSGKGLFAVVAVLDSPHAAIIRRTPARRKALTSFISVTL